MRILKSLRIILLTLLFSLLATEPAFARVRHFHPASRRFIQSDPAGYVDGMSAYEYEGSSPLNLVDPYGLWIYFPGTGKFSARTHS